MLYLISKSFLTRLHDNSAGTSNVGTASGSVNIALRQIRYTINFHIGIFCSAGNILSRCRILQIDMGNITGTAEGGTLTGSSIRICSGYPLIIVVDKDLVALTQCTSCVFANDHPGTGQHRDILRHRHASGMHGNSHITVDWQSILV